MFTPPTKLSLKDLFQVSRTVVLGNVIGQLTKKMFDKTTENWAEKGAQVTPLLICAFCLRLLPLLVSG